LKSLLIISDSANITSEKRIGLITCANVAIMNEYYISHEDGTEILFLYIFQRTSYKFSFN